MKRIALQVIAFNVDTWINQMLVNASPYVDKIFIAYPDRPWNYNPTARLSLKNPTDLGSIRFQNLPCDVEIVRGDWERDEDTRNDLLDRARMEGYEWMVIQDADEFYTEKSWNRLRSLMMDDEDSDLLITPWFNFWKNPQFVISDINGSIKSLNEGFAIRAAKPDVRFTYSRTSNCKSRTIIDEPCYHYGYVVSDLRMRLKVKSWAHVDDSLNMSVWYKYKWLKWNESVKYLHPGNPPVWDRAIRFPLSQPSFATEFMNINSEGPCSHGVLDYLVMFLWDRIYQVESLRRTGRSLLGVSLRRLLRK